MPYTKSDGVKQRGVYIVNPYIIAKGKWENVKKLRATFDFIEKTFSADISTQKDVSDFLNEVEENDSKKTA